MQHPIRVLITNNSLNTLAGSELYVLDLAKSLIKLGHKPMAYSCELGLVADRLRKEGIPVTDDLNTIGVKPDIIHGHHHLDTLTALLHFPDVPAIYYCHGSLPWQEHPLRFPRIYKYVAVCNLSMERFIVEGGIPSENIRTLLNFVDLERFKPREPLPETPKRALAFSGFMEPERFNLIKKACNRCGITHLDKIGRHLSETHPSPEKILGDYDLVFAKGRAALEALAMGVAVISCDGAGSMVTTQNLHRQLLANFGLSERHHPYNVETIIREIQQYNSKDAELVSKQVRVTSNKETVVDEIIALYREAIIWHQNAPSTDFRLEEKAVSDYLRALKLHFESEVTRRSSLKPRLLFKMKVIGKKLVRKMFGISIE